MPHFQTHPVIVCVLYIYIYLYPKTWLLACPSKFTTVVAKNRPWRTSPRKWLVKHPIR